MDQKSRFVFEGEMTREDVAVGYREYLNRARPLLRSRWGDGPTALLLLVLANACSLLLARYTTPFAGEVASLVVLTTGIGLAAGIILWALSTRSMVKRMVELATAEIGPMTVTVQPDRFAVRNGTGSHSETPWSAISKIELSKETLLVWHDVLVVQRVPRRLLGGEAREAELIAALRQWAPHATGPL